MNQALRWVRHAIEAFGLLGPGDSVIIGFSGGPDSLFLALALKHLARDTRLRLHLAHLNHGIRDQAENDQRLAVHNAQRMGLDITVKQVDVPEYARRTGLGLEEAARNLRYRFLEEVRNAKGFNWIATAHTLDDWMESWLMNAFRGAGIRGLRSIPVKRDRVIRPMILVDKASVLEFLEEAGFEFALDHTNQDIRMTRNWFRHRIVPVLQQRFPRWQEPARRLVFNMNEAFDYLQSQANQALERSKRPSPPGQLLFNRHTLMGYNKLLIKMALAQMLPDITSLHLEGLCDLVESGGALCLPGKWKAEASFGDLRLFQKELPVWTGQLEIRGPGEYPVPELNTLLVVREQAEPAEGLRVPVPRQLLPLIFRTRRPGDRWGSSKLKKKMIDLGIPRWRRDRIGLLTKGKQVLWIPGFASRLPGSQQAYVFEIRRLTREFWIHDT